MNPADITLSSPMSAPAHNARALLCLTIVWHPDTRRIGEQAIATGDTLELARFQPLFCQPQADGLGLGYGGISREPLRLVRDAHDGVHISLPNSRMVVELNGQQVHEGCYLTSEQLRAGAILGLGRAVLLCLHWMDRLPKLNPVAGLVGVGAAAIKTRELIRQAASTDVAVLLLGETGTGKEVAARAIHAMGQRAARPLVSVNMAALNEALAAADLFGAARGAYTGAQTARQGLFGQAEQATLFLDEIGNTPASVQPMLLRVLETGDYRPLGASQDLRSSARLIAATDQDLYGGGFNPALLRRLEGFIIQIPPLRARREDIGLLICEFLADLPAAPALPQPLVSQFANYDWPGNIRQLRHQLRRVALALQMGEVPELDFMLADTLPPAVSAARAMSTQPVSARRKLAEVAQEEVLAALENNGWQILGAARALAISRPSMYRLIEEHPHIRRPDQIGEAELRAALAASGGELAACAAQLKTPAEALRRHLRHLDDAPTFPRG
ncbi:sigma-54-dependent Fis family transcriptional regulator [Oxalobacteraceae bacterium]|nr:sigma-54-dependent Fis family transcriptional regulator [Oxalobacteraceae bacterium]